MVLGFRHSFLALAACVAVSGSAALAADTAGSLSLMNFQVNGIAAAQGGMEGGKSISGQVGWTPRYSLSDALGVRGVVAGTIFKGTLSNFIGLEAQAMASYGLGTSWLLEAGGGAQMWLGQSLLTPLVSGNVAWKPASPWFSVIDRLFVGYSYALAPAADTHQLKLGAGIAL